MSDYVSLEQDPASGRLTPDRVMDIHFMHRGGFAWDDIAAKHHITRKNVQRIVQGRRWKQLHPDLRPDLYEPSATIGKPGLTLEEVDRAWVAAFQAFKAALQPPHV